MLAALALHGRTPSTATRRAMFAAGAACVLADATIKAALPAAGIDATQVFVVVRDVLSAFGFALIIGAAASAPNGRLLGNRVLARLGTISYGFYLWHVPVLVFLRGHDLLPQDPVLGTLTALGPVVAVSALSWIALERPIIAWAARRNERSRTQPQRRRGGVGVGGGEARTSGSGGVDRRAGAREVSTVRA
jgi:peptidoglycan/LPS O-acetylase OafA/YrhL